LFVVADEQAVEVSLLRRGSDSGGLPDLVIPSVGLPQHQCFFRRSAWDRLAATAPCQLRSCLPIRPCRTLFDKTVKLWDVPERKKDDK